MDEWTLLSWNVNGLRAVMKRDFADFAAGCGADVLCLQETKLTEAQAPVDALPFEHQYYHSAERAGYSGTALLSHREPQAVWHDFDGVVAHPCEGRVQTADFGPFYLVNAYVPNSQDELRRLDYRQQWDADFRRYLVALNAEKPVVVCGDFNVAHEAIDLARPKANRRNAGFTDEERSGLSAHLGAGFVDVFRQRHPDEPGHYSWWSYRGGARERNVGWRIDYFIVSDDLAENVSAAWIQPEVLGSDHCPVGVRITV